jgi:uncharacterized protein YxjI
MYTFKVVNGVVHVRQPKGDVLEVKKGQTFEHERDLSRSFGDKLIMVRDGDVLDKEVEVETKEGKKKKVTTRFYRKDEDIVDHVLDNKLNSVPLSTEQQDMVMKHLENAST